MLFSSLTFLLLFLPTLLIIYHLNKNVRYKNIVLLIFSLLFYSWGEPIYIFLMIFSIVINYISARFIEKYKKNLEYKKIILIITIILNLGILGFFKYFNFFIDNFNNLFNLNISFLEILLPIGISFYTFQILSYVIDVYRGEVRAQKNILTLGTYVSLFPQLIAGPIVRYQTIENELIERKETFDQFMIGFKRFIVGLGKKVIIANNMALIADTIYSYDISSLGTLALWLAAIAYTFQIYFDFSGYSDMAIGLGKMFGFNFLENFNYPYISKSITDFWRRWHISLSSWFRDYVYIPLGGNRVSKYRWFVNIIVVWMLTGLWHGASWNFILWGLYFGIILILEKAIVLKILKRIPSIFRHFYSLILIIVGWVLFRLENLEQVLEALRRMFVYYPQDFVNFLIEEFDVLTSLPFMLLAFIGSFPLLKRLFFKAEQSTNNWYLLIYNLFLIIVLYLSFVLLVSSTYNPFIYFRF